MQGCYSVRSSSSCDLQLRHIHTYTISVVGNSVADSFRSLSCVCIIGLDSSHEYLVVVILAGIPDRYLHVPGRRPCIQVRTICVHVRIRTLELKDPLASEPALAFRKGNGIPCVLRQATSIDLRQLRRDLAWCVNRVAHGELVGNEASVVISGCHCILRIGVDEAFSQEEILAVAPQRIEVIIYHPPELRSSGCVSYILEGHCFPLSVLRRPFKVVEFHIEFLSGVMRGRRGCSINRPGQIELIHISGYISFNLNTLHLRSSHDVARC